MAEMNAPWTRWRRSWRDAVGRARSAGATAVASPRDSAAIAGSRLVAARTGQDEEEAAGGGEVNGSWKKATPSATATAGAT